MKKYNDISWLLAMRKIIIVPVALPVFFFFISVSSVAGQTWTGNLSNSWHESGNWDSGTVPGSNSSVTIGSVSPNPFPVIIQDVTVETINLSDWSGGELKVTNEAVLTVTESFNINNNGHLFLDDGVLQFEGNGKGGNIIKMGYTNTLIHITHNGSLNSPYAHLQVNGEILVNGGNLNLGYGFQLSSGKLLQVTDGQIAVFGETNIYGNVDGGTGNFVFDGNPSKNKHKVTIRSGGRFYMAPSSPGNHPPDCPPDTQNNPPHSGGTIDFFSPSFVENNGRLYGGNAQVTFHESTNLQGDAEIEVHNGTVHFLADADISNTAFIDITCKGTIHVEGDCTFRSNGNMKVGSGNFVVSGDAVFQNNGTLNADEGHINFNGNVTLANSGGIINAGSQQFRMKIIILATL